MNHIENSFEKQTSQNLENHGISASSQMMSSEESRLPSAKNSEPSTIAEAGFTSAKELLSAINPSKVESESFNPLPGPRPQDASSILDQSQHSFHPTTSFSPLEHEHDSENTSSSRKPPHREVSARPHHSQGFPHDAGPEQPFIILIPPPYYD